MEVDVTAIIIDWMRDTPDAQPGKRIIEMAREAEETGDPMSATECIVRAYILDANPLAEDGGMYADILRTALKQANWTYILRKAHQYSHRQ